MLLNKECRLARCLSRSVLGLQILLWGAASAQAQGVDPWKPNDDSFEGYMAREPMRREAEALASTFIETARAGNTAELLRMVSPTSVQTSGRENVERHLDRAVVPFFAQHRDFGRSTTTSTAKSASGHFGFAFYRYSVRANGEKKPFVIYVTQENGRWHVANILVDHFVPGRHRPSEQ
ncbi:hypothetical protein [Microvirga lenta]|uniref:hypothetical protein n=1 Tax=Microvirga lenta TaxID=2881337 RepID=UPI001CFF65F7|nr:hypothetical protein [Microvirga lenta]MCB5174879.1 hypothetical protein [Microvirga lenta]